MDKEWLQTVVVVGFCAVSNVTVHVQIIFENRSALIFYSTFLKLCVKRMRCVCELHTASVNKSSVSLMLCVELLHLREM